MASTVRQNAGSVEAAARYLELSLGTLRSAVRYYAAFPEEIDAWIDRQSAIAERERVAADRERAISG